MSCDNVITVQDLETDKKHSTFYREVITGKAGGTGDYIDSATNAVTGQTQATLPKVLSNVGFSPAGFDFTTGGTLTERDKAIFYQADGNWYSWGGTLPKVVPPTSSPASTGGIADNAWNVSTSAFMYRDWEGFTAELLAQAGIVDDGQPDELGASQRVDAMSKICGRQFDSVAEMLTFARLYAGQKYSTGSTIWQYKGFISGGISDFVALTPVSPKDFGAVGDGLTDDTDAIQQAIDSITTASGGVSYQKGFKLVFPKAVYLISKPLILKGDNLNIDGQNSTLIKNTNDLPARALGNLSVPGGLVSPMQNSIITCETAIRFSKIENFNLSGVAGVSQPTAIWMIGNENIFSNIYIRDCLDGIHTPSMWVNTIQHVVVRSGRHGFWFDRNRLSGGVGQAGTSTHFINCASFGATGKGFYLQDVDYSSLTACAADGSAEEAYAFEGCSGLSAQVAFESRSGDTTSAIRLASGTCGSIVMDCYETSAKTLPVISVTESKIKILGRMRHSSAIWIKSDIKSEVDARGLSIDPISGLELDPAKFVIGDANSTIYYTSKSPASGSLYEYQFTAGGQRVTPQGAYLDSLGTVGAPYFIYGHSKLRVVYDVTTFDTTYSNNIVVPLAEIEKVIPNFSNSTWANTPLSLRIIERGNFGVGDWVRIESGVISATGKRSYTTHGNASKVAVTSITISGGNLVISLDAAGGSRQRVSCEITPLA